MFQTKNFLSISASLINWMRARTTKVTDYNVGGVTRTMLEATAAEIDEMYQQMVAGIVEAVPVATYLSFNFGALQAVAAGGNLRVILTASTTPLTIPALSTLTQAASAITFSTTADVVVPAGSTYVDIPIAATVAGANTNIPAGTAFAFQSLPTGFVSASNLVAFINGRDLETPTEQKQRFNAFISTLPRGTISALKFGARYNAFLTDANGNITENVKFVSVHEPYLSDSTQPPAWVQLYVHNGRGSTSTALVSQVQQILYGYYDANGNPVPGYKAAGTHLDIAAATEATVPITATLTVAPGYSHSVVAAQLDILISTYILGLDIGATCLMAEITTMAMETAGVANFVLAAGSADVTSSYSVKLMPGAQTIN